MSTRLQRELARLVEEQREADRRFSITPTGLSEDGVVRYDFYCLECGGYVLSAEEPVTRHSKASCLACGQSLGNLWEIERDLRRKLKQAGVDAHAGVDFRDAT